jgi:hypothetical protein
MKKDSKKKAIDPENVTMFISLDTVNLGKIDSLLNISKKNISLNMRLENAEIINFIKQNYKDLYYRLSEKGYKLVDVKYRLHGEEANIITVKEIVKKETQSNSISIDCRL